MATDESLKRKLIARTARVWGRLNKRLVKELNEITQEWIHKLIWHAEREIASGDISNIPEFPEIFTKILQQGLREAFAYGYWLQELYLYERRGRKYKGKITLAEGDNVKDLLEDFMSTGEWNDIVPEDAVNWIKNYVPKLAGVLNQDVLEATRNVIQKSLLEGTTLQERMKALREAAPELAVMAKHRIEAIARTEITRADSLGRIASAKQNEDAIGFEFSAIMDDRTTEICASRHGLVMRIDDPRLAENTPPLHVRCRSVLLTLTIYDYPDGLLTSHEFDDVPHSMQRPEDIEEVEKLLRAEMQQVIEEIEAKTIKEANELAVKLGVAHNADFKGLDLSAANELIKGIVENKKIFPELPTFDFVGSCQNHNSFLRDVKAKKIFEKNADFLRKKNPNFSDEEILSAVKRQIKIAKVSFNTLAFAKTNEGAKGISLNNAHFSTKEIRDLLDENNYFGLVNTVRLKYHPEGCATIKATIDHEIGHQIDNLLNVRTDMHILKLYNTNKSQMKENLSEYAGTMVEEFIAEAWSEYLNNENCRPLAKEVAERVKEIYKEKFKK